MSKETWRLIETGFHDAYFNMALDEVLMVQKEKDRVPSTLRFYGWKPAALSLGYTQNIEEEINLSVLKKMGLDCVSRFTGGGIIFHDKEITYSLAIGPDSHLFSGAVGESFRNLCAGIIKALELLGFQAKFARDESSLVINNADAFCFAAASSYDIIVRNRKLGGNAQRRKKRVIFQHGSIPLELKYETVIPALRNFTGNEIKVISLKELLNQLLTPEETFIIFKMGFRAGLDIELEPGELNREEIKMAQALSEEKREGFLKLFKKGYA